MKKDELSITVNGKTFTGWSSVAVTRSIEQFPSSFQLETTEHDPASNTLVALEPGEACTIKLGDDLILTGYIEQYNISASALRHSVHVGGRSKCCDMHDTSVKVPASQINFASLPELATSLVDKLGITVKNYSDDKGPSIPQSNVVLTESAYEIIERIARWAKIGWLVYDDTDGNLALSPVGKHHMSSGIAEGKGGNAQEFSLNRDLSNRYSEYFAVWQTVFMFSDSQPTASNLHGYEKDDGIKRYRPLVIQSEQSLDGEDLGQARATWERNRRFGRSQVLRVVVDSWRDGKGKLWEINSLVTCNFPTAKLVNKDWLIVTVTFRRDLNSGTTAELILMPPEAFSIEPTLLQTFDPDIVNALHNTKDDEPYRDPHYGPA